jgi:DNA-directed RNA polymerase omega subunit
MKTITTESKYCKVLVAAQRAKQLHHGASPRVRMPGVKQTRVALEEVERGLIYFESLAGQKDHR